MTYDCKRLTSLLVIVASIVSAVSARASPIPSTLVAALDQREQKSEQMMTVWHIESHAALASQIRAKEQRLPVSERSPATFTGSSTWRIVRSGSATLVSGGDFHSLPQFESSLYSQFYRGNVGMVFQKPLYIIGKRRGKTAPINIAGMPIVWPTPGDSRLYPSPASFGLPLLPAHFVALAGVSPAGLYGGHWSLASKTAKIWTLEATVASSQFIDARKFRVILDRSHADAPISILMWSLQTPAKENWEISGYKKYKDTWVGNKVIHYIHAPGIVETRDTYTLQSVSNSPSITLPITPKAMVRDYRLVANQLSEQDAIQADNHQKRGIVYYSWNGRLPDREELKRIQAKQNPGEATPDPSRLSSVVSASNMVGSVLPFAGGVLCLVGGVWMFKQRRAN